MNDKPAIAETAPFDPAQAGWKAIKQNGFGDLAGPIWRNGDARFGFVVEAKHLNFNNVVHGGMLTTLADQAMGMTALRASGNKPHATIELSIQFVGAVRLGEFVEAHCEIIQLTRNHLHAMQARGRHARGWQRERGLEDPRGGQGSPLIPA